VDQSIFGFFAIIVIRSLMPDMPADIVVALDRRSDGFGGWIMSIKVWP